MIGRREFITLVGGAAAAPSLWPLAARAQQPVPPVIGVLSGQTRESESARLAALRQGLKERGFAEGQNVAIEYRFADGQSIDLSIPAAELVRRRIAVLIASTTPAALAAKAATATIPIVFVLGADPVELRLVASFNRPGGNITGVAFLVNKLVAKRLELLTKLAAGDAALAMLADPNNPNFETDVMDAQAAAASLGRTILVTKVATLDGLDGALATLIQQRVGALFVGPHAISRLARSTCDAGCALQVACELPEQRFRDGRRTDELRAGPNGGLSAGRRLRRTNPAR
jgi:putative ABC transport system substrate-binding protein